MYNNNNNIRRGVAGLWLVLAIFLNLFMGLSHAADADLRVVTQVSTTNPAAGETFTYTIRYRCAAISDLYCAAPTITDTIPAPLKIVSYTPVGGNVAAVTLSSKTLTWKLATPADSLADDVPVGGLAAGSTGILKVQVKFPLCGSVSPPAVVTNQVTASTAGVTAVSAAAEVTVPVGIDVACPPAPPPPVGDFSKTGSADFVQPGGMERWSVKLPDSASAYTVTEAVPAGMQVYLATASNTPKVMGYPAVDCTDDGVDDFHALNQPLLNWATAEREAGRGSNLLDASGNPTGCVATLLPSGITVSTIKRLRWEVKANSGVQSLDLRFVVDGAYVGDNIRNCALSSQHGTACAADVPVLGLGQPILSVSKTTPTGGVVSPDGSTMVYNVVGWQPTVAPAPASNDHVYRVSVAVDELSGTGTQFPIVEDVLPAELDYLTGQGGNWWRVAVPTNKASTGQAACSNPRFSRSLQADGRVKLRWEFSGCQLPAGSSDPALAVYFSTRIRPGIPAGKTVSNAAWLSAGDHPLVHCANGADAGKTWQPLCRSSTTSFKVPELTNLDSAKWVKGTLDKAYSRTPTLGQTTLDGQGTYRLEIRNTGNVTHTQLEVEEVLPAPGDTGLVTATPRGSQWSAVLAGELALQRVAADGSTTPIPSSEVPGGLPDPAGEVDAFRLVWVPVGGLRPGEALRIEIPVRQRAGETAVGGVAWNSFAYTAQYFDTSTQTTETLLRTEPPKVGLARVDAAVLAGVGDYVWFDSNGNGQADAGEPALAEVSVRLYDGATLVAETVTDAAGHYALQGLLPNHAYTVQAEKVGEYPLLSVPVTTGVAGSFRDDADMGFTLPAALGDRVWFDRNGDGAQDGDEAGVAGVTVTLRDTGGNSIAVTQTDAQGAYWFGNVSPGAYVLGFSGLPEGYVFTRAHTTGDPQTDSDVDASGNTGVIPLLAGARIQDQDAGVVLAGDEGKFSWGTDVDLRLGKTVDKASVKRGELLTYTLTVRNGGPGDASAVQVGERLPPGMAFQSASPAGVYDPASGVWSVGAVVAGTAVSLRLTARVE